MNASDARLEPSLKRILVVDDEEDLLELVRFNLAKEGYAVTCVTSGEEAIRAVRRDAPDLVVLDIMLPDINGKEVCQRVRKDHPAEEVKIICISGMVEEDKIADLKTAGANDFLHKPFEVDQLIERMCRMLDIETASTR